MSFGRERGVGGGNGVKLLSRPVLHSACFFLSSLLRFLVKDDMWQQAKIPVNKRPSSSPPTVCFRATGKTLRFKSSWSPGRVLTGISDCRSLKRRCVCVCVCVCVYTCASVIQTHTRYTGEGWQLPDCGAGADAMLLPSDTIKRFC